MGELNPSEAAVQMAASDMIAMLADLLHKQDHPLRLPMQMHSTVGGHRIELTITNREDG